jgi:HK97 family phage prohead protease
MQQQIMQKSFNFFIPLKKDALTSDSLTGIASTTVRDRDDERMSEKALRQMVEQINGLKGINLFGNHEHNWENTLGALKSATLIDDNSKVQISIALDDPSTNPKIPMLLNKLKRGIVLGLSVGGNVTETKWEYDAELRKKIKILDAVDIFEVSVVGIPSNPISFLSIPGQISKCFQKGKSDSARQWIRAGKTKDEVVNRLMDAFDISESQAEQVYMDAAISEGVNKGLNNKICPLCYGSLIKKLCPTCLWHE